MKQLSANINPSGDLLLAMRRPGAWLVALMLLCLLLQACQSKSPEQQLRQQLAAMEQALESHQTDALMTAVSTEFVGNQGMDRAALQQLIRAQMLVNKQLGATIGPTEVVMVDDRHATVAFPLLLTAGNRRWLPEGAQTLRLVTGWQHEQDGHWRIHHAQWTPLQ